MYIKTFILPLLFLGCYVNVSASTTAILLICRLDTSIEKNSKTDSIINAVIHSNEVPAENTSEVIGQFTQYGFRNLFTDYHYNPDQPYATQINPNAEVYMSDFLKAHSQELHKMKTYAIPYFNFIDNIFKQYHLPTELKYLAVIESGLKKSATSWVGAAGPWQFMPNTARVYGLQVGKQLDERRDYYKSTHAAARFLLHLYKNLNDWLLVIAAYNSGPERVYDAMKKSGSRDFWKLQYYLPLESRNHVKKFIATHYTMEKNDHQEFINNNTTDHGKKKQSIESKNISTLSISGKYNAATICSFLSITEKEFEEYNPHFNQTLIKSGSYELLLPLEKMELFKQKKYDILNECVRLLLE